MTNTLNRRRIDEMEDIRIIILSRAQGAYGIETAQKYANSLMHRAMNALACADLDEAVWLSEREVQFNTRAFGLAHRFTRTSLLAYKALKRVGLTAETPCLSPRKDDCRVA